MHSARLAHTIMTAALSGNPRVDPDKAGDRIHAMYKEAVLTMPYLKPSRSAEEASRQELVDAWREVNGMKDGDTE